jgi:2-dehydropantoate 2-reductase
VEKRVIREAAKRDYVIVGAGAIGGTLAFHLARAGHPVLAVDVDSAHVAAIRARGITIVRDGVRESVRVPVATPREAVVHEAPRVLLCVKGVGSTEKAAEWIAPRLAPHGVVVSVQNGLQTRRIADRVGFGRTVGAFVDFFADVVEPGLIEDGGAGMLMVGEVDGACSERVDEIVADLQAWGPARATRNIAGFLWAKLGFSAMLAATALADAPMAELIDRHRDLMLALVREVFAVAQHGGIKLESFDSFDPAALSAESARGEVGIGQLVAWLKTQSKTRSGVWRDIAIHHRPTEAAGRYSEVIAAAERARLPSPHLRALVEILREVETGMRAMSERNLEDLRRKAAAPASA